MGVGGVAFADDKVGILEGSRLKTSGHVNDLIASCVMNPLDVVVGGANIHIKGAIDVAGAEQVESLVSVSFEGGSIHSDVASNVTIRAEKKVKVGGQVASEILIVHELTVALTQEGRVHGDIVGVEILENAHINHAKVVYPNFSMSHDLVAVGVDEGGPIETLIAGKLITIPSIQLVRKFERVVVLNIGPVVLRELLGSESFFNGLGISRKGQ